MKTFYMRYREAFDDQEGWFTHDELQTEIKRIEELDGEGEAEVLLVIQGRKVDNPKSTEKLVRDWMPNLCHTTPGWTPMSYREIHGMERSEALVDKLIEETFEVVVEFEQWARKPLDRTKHKLTEELADLKEVITGIVHHLELDVRNVKKRKYEHRGGFLLGRLWDGKK